MPNDTLEQQPNLFDLFFSPFLPLKFLFRGCLKTVDF